MIWRCTAWKSPKRPHHHHQQPRTTRDPDHDGRPPAGPIRDGPTAIGGLRTRRRRPVLPPTPKAKAGPSDYVGLTGTTAISHHQHGPWPEDQLVPSSWQTSGPMTLAGDTQIAALRL